MKALNKKERNNAMFKFGLIYSLTFLLLLLFFWQFNFVEKQTGGGTATASGDYLVLEKQFKHVEFEINEFKEFQASMLGAFGHMDGAMQRYQKAEVSSTEAVSSDAINNKQNVLGIVDSIQRIIRDDYEVAPIETEKRGESVNPVAEKSMESLNGLVDGTMIAFNNRNQKIKHMLAAASDYFDCRRAQLKTADVSVKDLVTYQIKTEDCQKDKLTLEDKIFSLNTELDSKKDQLLMCRDKGTDNQDLKSELKDLEDDIEKLESDKETLVADQELKLKLLEGNLELAIDELENVTDKINKFGDKNEVKALEALSKKLQIIKTEL